MKNRLLYRDYQLKASPLQSAMFGPDSRSDGNAGPTTYAAAKIAESIAYWKLSDGPAATTAVDELGSHDGAYYNSPTHEQTGAILTETTNKAVLFDYTTSEYMAAPGSSGVFDNIGDFKVEAWFKTTDSGSTFAIYSKADEDESASTPPVIVLQKHSTNVAKIGFRTSAGGTFHTVTGVTAINDGNYHHIVATREGTLTSLYVDGSLDNSGSPSGVTIALGTNTNHQVGRQWNGPLGWQNYAGGTIDDVSVSDVALSSTDVTAHRNLALGL